MVNRDGLYEGAFAKLFLEPGDPPNPYWPGTVTWVEESGAPRRRQLLLDRPHGEMTELISRATRR